MWLLSRIINSLPDLLICQSYALKKIKREIMVIYLVICSIVIFRSLISVVSAMFLFLDVISFSFSWFICRHTRMYSTLSATFSFWLLAECRASSFSNSVIRHAISFFCVSNFCEQELDSKRKLLNINNKRTYEMSIKENIVLLRKAIIHFTFFK